MAMANTNSGPEPWNTNNSPEFALQFTLPSQKEWFNIRNICKSPASILTLTNTEKTNNFVPRVLIKTFTILLKRTFGNVHGLCYGREASITSNFSSLSGNIKLGSSNL